MDTIEMHILKTVSLRGL